MIEQILNKLFGDPEEVNGEGRCDTYLYRWVVKRTRWGNLYIHHFVGEDWALDLHDHPKDNISIGVYGSYLDISDRGKRVFSSPFIRFFQAEYRHRIVASNCWTILLVGPKVRKWGFFVNGTWKLWSEYVNDVNIPSSCD